MRPRTTDTFLCRRQTEPSEALAHLQCSPQMNACTQVRRCSSQDAARARTLRHHVKQLQLPNAAMERCSPKMRTNDSQTTTQSPWRNPRCCCCPMILCSERLTERPFFDFERKRLKSKRRDHHLRSDQAERRQRPPHIWPSRFSAVFVSCNSNRKEQGNTSSVPGQMS